MVKRFSRTLEEKICKNFIATDTKRQVEVLDDLVQNYDTSYHRTIKMTPEEAVQDPYEMTENTVKSATEPSYARAKTQFKPGDYVRILKY